MVNEEVVEFNKKAQPTFKSPVFQQKFRSTSSTGKKRTWRSLKQVLAQERALPWPAEVVHYSSINAPPSFKPAKKYSDISGLPVSYRDNAFSRLCDWSHAIKLRICNSPKSTNGYNCWIFSVTRRFQYRRIRDETRRESNLSSPFLSFPPACLPFGDIKYGKNR